MATSTPERDVDIAKEVCEKAGSRLTETRQRMLEVLRRVNTPLSAYEITKQYNLQIEAKIKTMSVYRILDFLESVHLVHRLQSINKYVICNHALGACQHSPPVYMICKSCQRIEEVEIASGVVQALTKQANGVGYSSLGSQIELYSLCATCEAAQLSTTQPNTSSNTSRE